MSLKYILRRVSSESGLSELSSNTDQRKRAIDLVNIAAEEIWEMTDLPGCLEEILVLVAADFMITLPPYVGEIRAAREKSLMHKWTLNDMRPRYQQEPWKQLWRNWRHKGYRAYQLPITNAAPLLYSIATYEDVSIVVTGRTGVSNRVSETITFLSPYPTILGTESFIEIESICDPTGNPRTYDISIQDSQETFIAMLYNNEISTRYILLDVSQYPFGGEAAGGERVMEVMYKRKLRRMANDADTFNGSDDWDNVIVDKVRQLLSEGQEGKEERAILFGQKVRIKAHEKIKHQEGGLEKEVQFTENPFYGLTKRPYSRIWRG